jgi:hypothetical protein
VISKVNINIIDVSHCRTSLCQSRYMRVQPSLPAQPVLLGICHAFFHEKLLCCAE